ncbi:auxilin-like protein 1 isoform X2 [Spinacia oleracea]|uniref:Auxilin-like protein 1 isoform X2 n=1 Tax=Spinacia oleracea TaxID=3562 RepID=A0A9R0KBK9_SPIOL|nr:auxilin-like protein 1 isoform X2 [Spinacia oleracea]
MERAYSHTRPPTFSSKKKPPPLSSSSSSSNFLNNGGFFTTTSYDDVFGGPPKFTSTSSSSTSTLAPRAEDYTEIFGAFRSSSSSSSRSSSSIPVLDLPAVPDDIHSAAAALFDYSEVFGGFNAVDFAVPFDQLFRPCDSSFCDGDGDGDASSDEAWTPVGTESLSDDSDPFALSENSQSCSSENYHQPSETKQFNVSYHKVNPGASTDMPNMTHIAQLNGVSGYTCVFDEATSLKETGTEMCSPVVDDTVLSTVSSSELPQKNTRKATSHASYDSTGLKSSNSDQRSGKACVGSISHVNSVFASVSDTNLRTEPSHLPQPSRPPPVLASNGDFSESSSSPMGSERCGLEANVDGSLPPFFDMEVNAMEVDASSSAAASAAAMKDAMEKAQVKLKAAKESRDRKDGVQYSGKLQSETDINGASNVHGAHDECLAGETRVHATSDRGPSKMKNSAKTRHAKNASQNSPDNMGVEQPTGSSGKPAETKQGKKISLTKDTDVTGEWKEARQYYEFVSSDTTRLAPQLPSRNGDTKTGTKQQADDDRDSDSAGEACITGESRRRLKATKAVSRQEYYEKMVKVAQEVHDSVICGHVEPDKKLKRRSQGNPRPPKSELIYEPGSNEISQAQKVEENPGEAIQKETEKRSTDMLEKEECKKESEACHSEQVDKNAKGTHESRLEESSEIKEEDMREAYEMDESDFRVQDPVSRVGHERKAEESVERLRTESIPEEASKTKRNKESREVSGKRSKESFKDVLIGDRIKTSHGSEEKDNTKDLQQMKAADKRLNKAYDDVSVRERLQRTCESQENITARNLQRKAEDETHLEQAVDGQGPEKSLEKCVGLEKWQKDKEAPEKTRSQGLYEGRNLISDHKNIEEGQKQDENIEKKLEKTTELEHMGYKSLQACDSENTWKINENSGDRKVQKGQYISHIKIELVDEDQGPRSIPDREPPTVDKHLKSSNVTNLYKTGVQLDMSCKPNMLQKKNDGSQEATALKGNGEIGTTSSDEKSKLEAEKTVDVLTDDRRVEPTASELGANDHVFEGRTMQASDSLDLTDNNTETDNVCTRNEQTPKEEKKKVTQLASNPNLVKGLNVGVGRKRNLLREDQVLFDHEEKVRSTPAEDINGFDEHSSKEEQEVEVVHTVPSEGKDSFQNVGQSIEKKGNRVEHSFSLEEKDEKKEIDLEEERLRTLEEERDRLREREKDRMAVEIAVREARDRAYADARDRAERAALERATDEARQRAMSEARERLEKACAEARERSLGDKSSSEARLRVERAAVERANAEARQRAIEKAMAERATFGARERMQRSVSEKYTSERDVIMRQSSFPTNSERFEAANSEPAERCKARLERHRRTVERVAKALAEKNMRDLLSQREQAERTRFAETLDADIKRWSGGKEGNLRALLSTLQYILGPDSGWHPLPLTEVITAAAVKKAYRKATLCVHPDKLQQRGATVQQKYICEKVFDLLKEAWNRFNSEEK